MQQGRFAHARPQVHLRPPALTGENVDIILSNTSDLPIYEQIARQIKAQILSGELACGEKLPSIRALANGLRVSVITTKRAYSDLEQLGFIETVQGMPVGFVAATTNFIMTSGPIVITSSKCSPASNISLSGTQTLP